MDSFDLYYWPVPFRGQFIRAILAYKGCEWAEQDAGEISELMARDVDKQPVGFMGPPLLIDRKTGFAISQMPAIAMYLGDRLNLLPSSAEERALTLKIINDANDVLDEITLDGGRDMWTAETWREFIPRLQKWMRIFETLGVKHGLTATNGFVLGTKHPSLADVVLATLWGTMTDRFTSISRLLVETAPAISGLSKRMMELEPLAALRSKSFDDYGQSYCGGEIEKSLRAVAD